MTSAVRQQGPLAMIGGGGSLPLAGADQVASSGRRVVLFPLRGAAEGTAVERFPHHWLHIGQIGKFMRLARAEGCRDVVLIGALIRPSIWQTRPDFKALMLMPRILAAFRGGDNHLLSGMGRLLEQDGFRLLGAHEVAPEILAPENAISRVQPSEQDHPGSPLRFAIDRACHGGTRGICRSCGHRGHCRRHHHGRAGTVDRGRRPRRNFCRRRAGGITRLRP